MLLRQTVPFSRFNNDLFLTKYQQQILLENAAYFNETYVHDQITGSTNDTVTRYYAPFLTKSFVYVVTETVCEYPYPYFSEKTWKGINTGCPFMMINARYSLQQLKNFGFKTFDRWWDESYDTLESAGDRIEALIDQLVILSKFSTSQLQTFREEMQPIIEYNQSYLKTFADDDLANVIKNL